jgi:MFS family permease
MTDLGQAIAAMAAASLVAGLLAYRFTPRDRQRQMLVITFATAGMFAFLFYAAGRLYWAILIPSSAAIIWSNGTPVLSAIAAGVSAQLMDTPRWRRFVSSAGLSVTAVAAVFWPLLNIWLRPPPPGGRVWDRGVAIQTGWATCSPAAAATFLSAGGISVDEADMVGVCLTDASGTPTLGLYRGLKLTARQHSRDVEALRLTLDDLLSGSQFPVFIMVKLPESGVEDPRYEANWGWVPGLGHSVVVIGKEGQDGVLIGDPAIGLETWRREDLEVLWHGDAIRFVP